MIKNNEYNIIKSDENNMIKNNAYHTIKSKEYGVVDDHNYDAMYEWDSSNKDEENKVGYEKYIRVLINPILSYSYWNDINELIPIRYC